MESDHPSAPGEAQRWQAFEAEALPYLRQLYSSAFRLTRNAADAEDLVQETFLRAYRGFGRYASGTSIRAWLYTILRRAFTDQLRKRGRSPKTVELVEDRRSVPPPQDSIGEGDPEVAAALAALPEAFRMAVVLRDVEDFSYAEIAGILDVPIGTVMSRIHRGRALLREALAHRRGGLPPG